MSETHQTDKVCSCKNCTMIDCLEGDPILSPWEKKFIHSLVYYGWQADYTVKQSTKLLQIWLKILRKRDVVCTLK